LESHFESEAKVASQIAKSASENSDLSIKKRFARILKRESSAIVVLIGLLAAAYYPSTLAGFAQLSVGIYVVYFMWITLSESWNLIGGYAGLLNLGMAAFFVLGSIVACLAMTSGATFLDSMLIAGVAGSLFAVVLIPTFRLRSEYFAIGTLVVPFILRPLMEHFTGKSSFFPPVSDFLTPVPLYYLGIAISGGSIFAIYFLMKSRIGLALRAMGDDENASSSLGVNTILYKTIALMVSGFIAALAGAYYVQIVGSVNTTEFGDLTYSLYPIFMVIIGGSGTFEGPVVGALIFSFIDYSFTDYFPNSNLAELFFAVVIMAVAVMIPKGVVPMIRRVILLLTSRIGKTKKL
jgi:branched-chain amino acid transport system permease protein